MKAKEASARIKINRLLDEAGWRFFDDENGPANIVLEPNTKITDTQIDDLGNDFETTKNGFIDFLLLDRDGKPLIVLEAKSEAETLFPPKSRRVATRVSRMLGSSSCRTATFTTYGICNKAIRVS